MISKEFFIHPKYKLTEEAQNYDICLVTTSINEFGIHEDLSKEFDQIPCLPEKIDLKKVF